MINNDYYALLGVGPSSSPDEISQAYHRQARQYHPDLHPDDAEADKRFKEINEAYQALSDPERRAQYDLERTKNMQSPVRAASAPTESTPDEQAVVYQKSVVIHSEDFDEAVGDFSAELTGAANQVADELREVMRDFAAELDAIVRSAGGTGGTGGNRAPKHPGFPPPPPRGNPGKAPKPKNS